MFFRKKKITLEQLYAAKKALMDASNHTLSFYGRTQEQRDEVERDPIKSVDWEINREAAHKAESYARYVFGNLMDEYKKQNGL